MSGLKSHFLEYLPLALMASLALGSYILVQHVPQPLALGPKPVPPPVVDYTATGLSIQSFDGQGRLKYILTGRRAWHRRGQETSDGGHLRAPVLEIEGLHMQAWEGDQEGPTDFQIGQAQLIEGPPVSGMIRP
jgi:hypothetical protein